MGRELAEAGQKVSVSSYRIYKYWGYNVQCDDYGQQDSIMYLKVAKRVNLKNSHHKGKDTITMWSDRDIS